MPTQNFAIGITDIVAWYGAIVATIGLIVATLTYFRDRAKITIKCSSNYIYDSPSYKEGVLYFNITIINKGRRPIRMENAGVKIIGQKGTYLLADSFANHRNAVLTEENPRTEYFVEQSKIDISKILYVVVYDGFGNGYKKWFFSNLFKLIPFGKKS